MLVLGVPLNNETSMIPLNPLQKRLTIPVCPGHHPVYVESECESMYSILITCETDANPPDTDFISYPCRPRETCIQFYVDSPDPDEPPIPHAQCIANEYCREWDNNHRDPLDYACSTSGGYNTGQDPTDLEVAFITYDRNNLPIQVYSMIIYYKDDAIVDYTDVNNISVTIPSYEQGEKIEYCFEAGTENVVTAYGAAQRYSNL
ncbi:hypothetical protein RclHR1_00080014 [Rhizophagus clarus]|uniref:Uncharacterized protein n=1 Tax=Rhizophagus clarus TaxID=94130 RepID=A0A2Z6SMB1_9GLOM|nr:hypothetical protein RclHR1_00080014 [Rhizophagus clarus]GET04062.1 hypothetical protein GLOIN_2v1766585 [Rhizophagus clarus]